MGICSFGTSIFGGNYSPGKTEEASTSWNFLQFMIGKYHKSHRLNGLSTQILFSAIFLLNLYIYFFYLMNHYIFQSVAKKTNIPQFHHCSCERSELSYDFEESEAGRGSRVRARWCFWSYLERKTPMVRVKRWTAKKKNNTPSFVFHPRSKKITALNNNSLIFIILIPFRGVTFSFQKPWPC